MEKTYEAATRNESRIAQHTQEGREMKTKNEMARVIVAALFGMTSLPTHDDRRVRRCERSGRRDEMQAQYESARTVMSQRGGHVGVI